VQLSPAAPERALSTVAFEAFGGRAVVAVAEARLLARAGLAVQRVVADFDLACSRFRPDSELSAVNREPGRWVRVSPLFVEAVSAALRAARLTDGDVDPTVGGVLIKLGYDRDFPDVGQASTPSATPIARVAGWRMVEVDPARAAVRVAAGVSLDLGATAKALAADHAARAAAAATGGGALVSFSGDLAVVGSGPEEGWPIRVTDDHRADPDAPGQWITIRSGGLATSSTTVRRWRSGSGLVHHLIDPATGGPTAGPWRTASVAAGSCLDANIASTAAIVRGARSERWLTALGLPSRLVSHEGAVCHLAGWPQDGDDLPTLTGTVS
jgi:thiamine biosynthesis lipoprotein